MTLNIEKRDTKTKGQVKQLRLVGKVPGILYGKKQEPIPVLMSERDLDKIASTHAGLNTLLDLSFGEGKTTMALIRDYQAHPIHRRFTHIDLQAMDASQKIITEVPIELTGHAIGIEEGGILDQILRTVEVRCVVTNIPEALTVDVSEMKIGDSVHINDIKLPEGSEFAREMDYTVASLVPPTKEEEPGVPVEGAEGEAKEGEAKEGDKEAAGKEGEAKEGGKEGETKEGK